jgi:hypothetical protein
MIAMRRKQQSFGDGLLADEGSDLRGAWMSHADAVPADEEIGYVASGIWQPPPSTRQGGPGSWPAEPCFGEMLPSLSWGLTRQFIFLLLLRSRPIRPAKAL